MSRVYSSTARRDWLLIGVSTVAEFLTSTITFARREQTPKYFVGTCQLWGCNIAADPGGQIGNSGTNWDK